MGIVLAFCLFSLLLFGGFLEFVSEHVRAVSLEWPAMIVFLALEESDPTFLLFQLPFAFMSYML